jgi:anti-anti-sigma factor
MLKPWVQVREEDGVITAEFWDCLRLDPAPVADLRTVFEEYKQRTGRSDLVVDLNGVAFAGSAALGGFLAMRRSGARLIFCNVDSTVREVFRVSKLDPLFSFAVDKPAAVALAKMPRDTPPDGISAVSLPKRDGAALSGSTPLRRRKTI